MIFGVRPSRGLRAAFKPQPAGSADGWIPDFGPAALRCCVLIQISFKTHWFWASAWVGIWIYAPESRTFVRKCIKPVTPWVKPIQKHVKPVKPHWKKRKDYLLFNFLLNHTGFIGFLCFCIGFTHGVTGFIHFLTKVRHVLQLFVLFYKKYHPLYDTNPLHFKRC